MSALIELREKQQKLVADARAILDQIDSDTPEARAKELETQYDGFMAEYDQLEARAGRLERVESAQRALETPVEPAPAAPDRRADPRQVEALEHGDVFGRYLRHGLEGMAAEERNVMRGLRATDMETRAPQSTSGTAGGYLVPEGFVADVMKAMKHFGPMVNEDVARLIVTGSGNDLPWPTMDDTSNKGALLGENTQDSEQAIAFGQKVLGAYKFTSKIIKVSEELLEDEAVGIEALLADAMGERVGRIVNQYLTTGTGGGTQPEGIVAGSTLGKTTNSNSAITTDELIDLSQSVNAAYRVGPKVRFMFTDSLLSAIRKLKGSGDGQYIWQPADARTGAPSTLLGYPYSINDDMDGFAASKKIAVFGDFSRYVVRRVRMFAVRRLVERYADYFQVGFIGFARFDGALVDTSAVKHMITPA